MSYNISLMPITRWDPAVQFSAAPQSPTTPLQLLQHQQQQCFQHGPTSDYPIDALTGVLGGIFRQVCTAGIDPAVVGAVFKGAASALSKGTVDIAWPNGAVTRVGSNEMVIAGTCSGKTFALNVAKSPIVSCLDSEEYANHADSPLAFFEDCSGPALIKDLAVNPNGLLSSDEGGQLALLFQKRAAMLVKCLDSETIQYARSTTGRITVSNPCLTAIVELQPEVFQANKSAFGVGHGSVAVINRFFVANSKFSSDTYRLHHHRIPDQVLIQYQLRVEKLLAALIEQRKDQKPRPILRLSPEAQEYLIWTGEEIKVSMSPTQLGNDISVYLGRHAERVLKQAGMLHAFEHGPEGEVDLATVQASDRLARWSCKSFHELTYVPPSLSQLDMDTLVLERELLNASTQTGLTEFKFVEVRRNSPNIGLTTQRFNRAFAKLAGTGRVQRRKIGAIEWVQVVPHHYWGNLGSSRLID